MNNAKPYYTVCNGASGVYSEKPHIYLFLTFNKGEGNFSCSVKVMIKVWRCKNSKLKKAACCILVQNICIQCFCFYKTIFIGNSSAFTRLLVSFHLVISSILPFSLYRMWDWVGVEGGGVQHTEPKFVNV
jgi:hypothetical protein